jgi:hypothetical protein
MSPDQTYFEPMYAFPDENVQAAEAVDVVRHAIWKMGRGRRGRNPSMVYSGSRSRNPRECLRRAHEDLGFTSLRAAKLWLEDQPADWNGKLNLGLKPKPRNAEGFDTAMTHPYVQLDYPTRVQKFLSHLNQGDLADVRPIVLGINDARGKRSKLIMRIMSDPRPQDQNSIILDGRLVMRKGRAVHCMDDRSHAIFPGHMARLHIDPAQGLRHMEFLDVPAEDEY